MVSSFLYSWIGCIGFFPDVLLLDATGAVTEGFIGDFLERDVTNLVC